MWFLFWGWEVGGWGDGGFGGVFVLGWWCCRLRGVVDGVFCVFGGVFVLVGWCLGFGMC